MRAPRHLRRDLLLLAISVFAGLSAGACTTGATRIDLQHASALIAASGAEQEPAASKETSPTRLPAPENAREAQSYLSAALAALRADNPGHAAIFLDAILKSDHLSDRGRANIYWLAADAHRHAGHEDAAVNALGGFLVAADMLPDDEDLRRREVEARAMRLARKVKRDPALGRTPGDAIRVEDARDATGIALELGCVENGVATHGADNRRLEERRLICREDGHVVLWFDVTQVR